MAGRVGIEVKGRDLDPRHRRQMQRRSGGGVSGFARMVLGIACTVNARDELLETLKQIEAPGG